MSISEIFSKRNLEVLSLISKEKLYIREIADRLECSPATVHKAVGLFKSYGFVELEKKKNLVLVVLKENDVLLKIKELLEVFGENK